MVRLSLPAALGSALALLLLAPTGCAGARTTWNARVADSARWHLRNKPGLRQNDCSGLVCAVLKRAGSDQRGNARTMWRDARREGRITRKPQPGDLAFFDYTYDRNRNGKVDDVLTHIGVVVSIDDHGTLTVVHRSSRGITPLRVTPGEPAVHHRGKRVLNDYLRAPGYGPRNGARLSGQLLRGFAHPPGSAPQPRADADTRREASQPRQAAAKRASYQRWLSTERHGSRFD